MNCAGIFAPVPTPFDRDERVDLARLKSAFAWWLARPITGFVVLGSNGEAAFLDEGESDEVIAAARDLVPRSRPFIAGTGRESTRAAVTAAKRAAALGADAVLVRTPGFFKSQMTGDAFVRHYSAVADGSPVPVLLYNFTAVTGVNLPPPAVARLAAHPNIIGMKESSGDLAQIAEVLSTTPRGFQLLAGSSSTFHAALCAGVAGGVLALSCVVPEPCRRLFDLAAAGRHDEARALQRRILPLARLLGAAYGVAGLKAALGMAGCDVGVPRGPLAPAPGEALGAIRGALDLLQETQA
ncbi:MAG: dihydrodipicolinate synthase family protein [Acidobacteria bacterium]|nr:dihydrodipicolinate synthase family protein [Acidobacteriota bacterium]